MTIYLFFDTYLAVRSGQGRQKPSRYPRPPSLLSEFEADATARRLRQLAGKALSWAFDRRHIQAIHHYIFQDVFDWAGEFRTVNISKAGDPFAFSDNLVSSLNRTFSELGRESHLRGIDIASFAGRGAYYVGEINAVHAFRGLGCMAAGSSIGRRYRESKHSCVPACERNALI